MDSDRQREWMTREVNGARRRSVRVERRQVEVLLDTAQPGFEFGDEDAVSYDGRIILDDGAAESDDLLSRGLVFGGLPRLKVYQIRGDIRMSDFKSARISTMSSRISRKSRTRFPGSGLIETTYPHLGDHAKGLGRAS